MRRSAKQTALRLMANHPVYRALPPSGLRTYAALKYHGQQSPEAITGYIRSIGALPTRWLPTAVLAARAAFRTGQDDLLYEAISILERRHPDADQVQTLRADLNTFYGRYEEALRCAERAHRLRPSAAEPMARLVKLGYRVRARDEADRVAVTAIQRFPLNHAVLWQVAAACTTPQQYERVQAAWDERVTHPTGLLGAVRQLAVAAARSGRLDASVDLYRRAIMLLLEFRRSAPIAQTTTLAGLGPRAAIEDLCQALEAAGVPFFFAAGTVLGLVREGRPLSTDGDIDVGILDPGWDREALIALFTRHPRFDLDLHPQTNKIGLRHRGGSPIDIFRFYADGDRVWHDGVFVRWHNTPFEVVRHAIGGCQVPVPRDADRYLTENYGDWRTPDPAFDAFIDAPNLDITWPEYHRGHLLRRAYESLVRDDLRAARELLRRAGETQLEKKFT